MTLSTSLHIGAPMDYRLVFLKAREAIGIPAEHPFTVHPDEGLGWADGDWVRSHPDGFRSALDVSHNHGKPLTVDCDKWCDDKGADGLCDYHRSVPVAYIDVRLDTTYGYRGPNGEGCSDVHREVTEKLGAWLDEMGVPWACQDEFTGEWHERTPCPTTR